MKFKFLIIVIVAANFLSSVGLILAEPLYALEPPRFFSAIDDLPLMEGLVEDVGSVTVFETARGRIVEVFASGVMEQDRPLAFYNKALPQLGWQRKSSGLFQREGETLSLEFLSKAGPLPGSTSILTVGFRIKPSVN